MYFTHISVLPLVKKYISQSLLNSLQPQNLFQITISRTIIKICSRLPYPDIFGGASAMSASHFQLVNGFSNMFWGWGGEDDDMSMRIKMKGLHIARYPFSIAKYTMLPHEKQKANPSR